VVRGSLLRLQSACAGLSALEREDEASLAALAGGALPRAWAPAAYPSTKALAPWMADLCARVAFINAWLTQGQPAVFWLPGARAQRALRGRRCATHAHQSDTRAAPRNPCSRTTHPAAPPQACSALRPSWLRCCSATRWRPMAQPPSTASS
jgi:hypothetical protein